MKNKPIIPLIFEDVRKKVMKTPYLSMKLKKQYYTMSLMEFLDKISIK